MLKPALNTLHHAPRHPPATCARTPARRLVLLAACMSASTLAQLAGLPLRAQAPQTGSPSATPSPGASPAPTSLQPFGSGANSSTIISNPLAQPTLSPGALLLIELEARFAKAVAVGGGKAFAAWFADDAVTLNNGRPAVLGRANIALNAQWDPKTYQLTWTPSGAQMGPSNDMGFTWGRYEGHSTDQNGQPVITSGRYMTVWKKQPDGSWKVAMDASANEAPEAGECCTLPKP